METQNKLTQLYNQIYDKLREAVDKEDLTLIERYSDMLPQAKSLINESERIEEQGEILLKRFLQGEDFYTNNINSDTSFIAKLSSRETARIKRSDFLNKLDKIGVRLKQHKGVIYSEPNTSGLIGISFSGEQGDSWFLGLPKEHYKTIVLLCSNKDDGYDAIILPEEFCRQIINHLSSSHNQFKFSVRKHKDDDLTLYTKIGNFSVKKFVNNYEAFSKKTHSV